MKFLIFLISLFVIIMQTQAKCPVLGYMPNGEILCTDENNEVSQCSVKCDTGFEPTTGDDFITCNDDFTWSGNIQECKELCPPRARVDFYILLDCSLSMNKYVKRSMMLFVQSIADKYTIAPGLGRMTVIPFAKDIHNEGIQEFTTVENSTEILNALNQLPCSALGTRTGSAQLETLKIIKEHRNNTNTDAKTVLITLTDGRSHDDVISAGEELRKNGVFTYAVGLWTISRTHFNEEPEMIAMVADKDHYHRMVMPERTQIDVFSLTLDQEICPEIADTKRCPGHPRVPEFGHAECSKSNLEGSFCEFICYDDFDLFGSSFVRCDGREWSSESPACLPVCPHQAELVNGNIECDFENYESSNCTHTCNEGFSLAGTTEDRVHSTCNEHEWNRKAPCCQRPCTESLVLDITFVLDSSSSIGKDNWSILKSFLRNFTSRYEVSDTSSRFSLVRFNKEPQVDSAVSFAQFANNKDGFLDALDNLPYNGRGTFIGKAMNYTAEVLLQDSGNRPNVQDVVIVVTDGRSKDDVTIPSQRIREMGAKIFALGIVKKRERRIRKSLTEITGNPEHVFVTRKSFAGLTKGLERQVIEGLCSSSCSIA